MYSVKLVRKDGSEEEARPCSHYNVTRFTGRPEQKLGGYTGVGVRITLFPSGHEMCIPDHGTDIYVTLEGKTVDSFHWPERGT